MAPKKSVRKTSTKTPLKTKNVAKKQAVAKKGKVTSASKPSTTKNKGKVALSSKAIGTTKKPKKATKATVKKKTPAPAAPAKEKVVAKKTVTKKTKAAPKKILVKAVSKAKTEKPATQEHVAKKTASKKTKAPTKMNVVQSVPKPQKPTSPKLAVQKKTASVTETKAKPNDTNKPLQKSVTSSVSAPQHVPKSQEHLLSPTERYNIGGLFACAIERASDPDFSRLRAVLRYLDLSAQEKDNLIRLSEGFMIPKLFAESVPEQKVGLALTDLVKFAMKEGNYEKHWREEIRQIGLWLGVFPEQVEQIERQVMGKR